LDEEIGDRIHPLPTALKPSGHSQRKKTPALNRAATLISSAAINKQDSANFQHGNLLIEYEFGPAEYISAEGSGFMSTTAHVEKALRVKLDPSSRRLYLEDSSSFSRNLWIKWDVNGGSTPLLEKGSIDRAFIAYMDHASGSGRGGSTPELKETCGRSIWTVNDEKRIRIYWRDTNSRDHELQLFADTTRSSAQDKNFLVVDAEAAWTRWPNYERA
ncbi:hypothetical protein FRC01_011009, partial [Tulasnella sp. 417]